MENNQSMQKIKLSWLLRHCNDLVIMLNTQGEILQISDSAADLYHWNSKLVIGTNYFKQIEKKGIQPVVTKTALNTMVDEYRITQEMASANANTSHIIEWLLTRFKTNSESSAYVFLGKDITQQSQAEQQEKNTRLSLQHIISCMPGNVYWMDKNLSYLGCNQNCADFIGLKTPSEIIGKSYEDFINIGNWEREVGLSFKMDDLEVITTGIPKLNVEEPPVRHHNGQIINYLTNRVPILDENNKVIGVVGISIDITERKKMEVALFKAKEKAELANKEKLLLLAKLNKETLGRSSKQYTTIEEYAYSIRHYLLNIIANMPGNVYWMDQDLIYLGCNNNVARTLGLASPADIVGKSYKDFATLGNWTKDEIISFQQDDLEVLNTGNPKLNVEEPPIRDPTGKLIYFLTSRVPLRDDKNEVTGVVGISVDITELKEAQAELKKAEVRIEGMISLSASIAHELRTPLSAIQMGVSGVKDHFPALVEGYVAAKEHNLIENRPIHRRHLEILAKLFDRIEAETRYSNTIINMILVNVRQSGIATADFTWISIAACVEEAISRYPFKEKEANLVEWRKTGDFLFLGDVALMVHVLFNLIRNALYYIESERKGKIEIWYGADENNHILYFKDTAKGVPPDVLPKLFEKFHTTTRHGTGLGLAYCKMVMLAFGGNINCQSEYGQFTQFEMYFPKTEKLKE